LPRGLRDLLLARVAGLDPQARGVLRLAAAAGRDAGYPLLRAVVALPEPELRESLRRAVEHGVLVVAQAKGGFRFRHALLAEAVYATVLPGEREELHARLAEELARSGAATPAELAPHWAAAGRAKEGLVASLQAARQAEEVFGLSEAHAHLERALRLWAAVPDASELVGQRLDELCAWTAELASQTGGAPRAVELARQAIELVGDDDPLRAALLHERLAAYLFESGSGDTALAATERAAELVPAWPPSPERARVLAALATELLVVWRHDESLAVCQEALEVARKVGAREAELQALVGLGSNLAYLGRGSEGLARLQDALALAEEIGDPIVLQRAYVSLTDVLTMLGRPGEAARVGEQGLRAMRPYGTDNTVLVANRVEALLTIGEWDEAERASADALRAITANYPHMPLILRADLEIGRGWFDAARGHMEAARSTVRHEPGLATYDGYVAELSLWERRWADADEAVRDGITWARPVWGAQIRVWLCAKGLRAQAELATVARAVRDDDALRQRLGRSRELLAAARDAATEASLITPNAEGWRLLAEAEHERARGVAALGLWFDAAAIWDRLERPPVAAYCRWRQAEALVAAGASRAEASVPLQRAHAVATRIGATPLLHELQVLAERARLQLAPPSKASEHHGELLGLTPREVEVLALLARGYTNREIAAELVISVRTAGVHVSHILHKLGAPNRLEAAAVAHRLSAPRVKGG
jgi:DNA-binding CsgD family transcriptional regulator